MNHHVYPRILIGWSVYLKDAIVEFADPAGRNVYRRWSMLTDDERRFVRLLATDPLNVLARVAEVREEV